MRCAMCSYEFDATALSCHASCPLSKGCGVVCCPNCGYSTIDPARSRLTRWVSRLFSSPTATNTESLGSIPLLRLRPGQEARVVSLGDDDSREALQLNLFGLFPGAPIRLRQTRPVPVISLGETELALDRSVAANIQVELV